MGKPENPQGAKKPAEQKEQNHAPTGAPVAPKGAVGSKVGCLVLGCKDKDKKFNFCDEHFKQFKFGLITKMGEQVLDFERKFEHYQKWLKAQKVA